MADIEITTTQVVDEEENNTPLLIGSLEWRLQRFFQTQLTTKPFLFGSSLSTAAPPCPLENCPPSTVLPARYQLASQQVLDKDSVAGIVDTAAGAGQAKWLLRLQESQREEIPPPQRAGSFKRPGSFKRSAAGSKAPTDPEAAITAGGVASKALNVAGKFALAAAVVVDSYRLGKAVYEDIKEQETLGKRTAKTSASVASGWAGGLAGAAAGNSAGAVIGGTIGAAFGGIGAIPGAAVGSLVGCLVGGVTGGVGASMAAENIVDLINKEEIKGCIYVIDGQHLCIKPSSPPENDEQEAEWLEIIKLVATLALLRRHINIVAKQPLKEILSYEALGQLAGEVSEHTTSAVGSELLYLSRLTVEQELLQELCCTPQFFCSFLLLACTLVPDALEADLRHLDMAGVLFHEMNMLPEVAGELLCMADVGCALVWFNPRLGVDYTLEILRPHSPYLEIVETKKNLIPITNQ